MYQGLVRRQHEVGYVCKPRQTREHRAEEVSRRRNRGDLPPGKNKKERQKERKKERKKERRKEERKKENNI